MKHKLEEFKTLLDKELYFEAHEALEELWFPRRFEKENEILLLKGFINAAVSFELHKRGRVQSSKKVWANYLKYRPLLHVIPRHKKELYELSRYVEKVHLNQNSLFTP